MMNVISSPILLLCIFSANYSSFAQSLATSSRDVTGVISLHELCPFTNYCTNNATRKLEDKTNTPCCDYCSCAEDCWERGNCCEDKRITTARKPLETCKAVDINNDQKQKWGYYVINSCQSLEDGDLAKKCSGELKTSLEDSVWVTDPRMNKIYGNKHCALCNGVEEYVPWQLATDCMEALNGQNSPDEIVKGFMNRCSLTMEPPRKEDHTDNICLIPDISTCNVTSQWEVYDQNLEDACHRVQQSYIHAEMFGPEVVYGNIYCFLCNLPHQPVSELCRPLGKEVRTGTPGFVGLIDFHAIERKNDLQTTNADPVCRFDEIEDPYQKRCLKLTCPLLQSPIHGQCVKVLSATKFLGIEAVLVFNPVEGIKANTALKGYNFDIEIAAKNLRNTVEQIFGRCQPCQEQVFAFNGNKTSAARANTFPEWFAMQLFFYTNQRCQENVIVERINQMLAKEIQLPFGKKYMTLIMSAATEKEYYHYLNVAVGVRQGVITASTCPIKIAIVDYQQLSVCPSVPLNYTDYTNLMRTTKEISKKRLIEALFKQTTEDGNGALNTGNDATNTENNADTNMDNDATDIDNNGTNNRENFKVQVCFDAYLSVLPVPTKNDAPSSGPLEKVLFVVIMISSTIWD